MTDNCVTSSSSALNESDAFCAGRVAVAHERTRMERTPYGALCAVCGERWLFDDDETPAEVQ